MYNIKNIKNTILCGDALRKLKNFPNNSIDTIITSPPYWGLRDYGIEGQLGLEKTPKEYVAKMVKVFREVKRVLKKEGTCWLNLGDSYATVSGGMEQLKKMGRNTPKYGSIPYNKGYVGVSQDGKRHSGLKHKDLAGIPWRVVFALQTDGWYLRQDIIWSKPNPMPESVTDRCTKSHEYIFLLTKSPKYYFDNEAIKEPITDSSAIRLLQDVENQQGSSRVPGKINGSMKAVGRKPFIPSMGGGGTSFIGHSGYKKADGTILAKPTRNKRSVWTVTTKPFKDAHFATFPEDLIVPMIKAGCPEKGIVLDPFIGSGTTAVVARKLGRNYIGIELKKDYIKMAEKRLAQQTLL